MKKKLKFKNNIFNKNELKNIIYQAFTIYGITKASKLADDLKNLGFKFATKAGISISIEDLKIPPTKNDLILKTNEEIKNSDLAYLRGDITSVERFQKIIDTWHKTSEKLKNELVSYFGETDPLNSIYLMAFSGARGNLTQVRQLVGMRGLMSDPNGQIIDIPIIHNFREGLTITDYIMSAYGARKGVVDTALKTADSGYLTRRLIDVAQDVIIKEVNCLTKRCIRLYKKKNEINYFQKIVGRTLAEEIIIEENLIAKIDTQITKKIAQILNKHKIYNLKIHSPLTCESERSICQKCYGWDLSNGKLIRLGEAVGIIAAQSIGEPGTQLTMRTFHTGGIFTLDSSLQIRAKETGFFYFEISPQKLASRTIYGSKVYILKCESNFFITNYKNKKKEIKLPSDSSLFIGNKTFIKKDDLIAELPFKNQQKISSVKKIIAPHAGKILISANVSTLWILKGDVYNLLRNSIFCQLTLNQKISVADNLISFKLITKKEGLLNIKKNPLTKQIESLNINKFKQFFNFPIFWDEKIKKFVLEKKKGNYYILNFNNNKFNNRIFATELTKKYKTDLGGQILYQNNKRYSKRINSNDSFIEKNIKILFIPMETHIINKVRALLLITNKSKLTTKQSELIPGIFSKTNGFVQIKESNDILEKIQIKPCILHEYLNLNQKNLLDLKEINKKIFFPGEIIFEDILIEKLCLTEIIKRKNIYNILLRPIQEFNIPKVKNLFKFSKNIEEKLKLENKIFLNYTLHKKQHKTEPINLIESIIDSNNKNLVNLKKRNLKFYILPNFESKSIINLTLIEEYHIDLEKSLPKQLIKDILKIALFVNNLDIVEKKSIIGSISMSLNRELEIKKSEKDLRNPNTLKKLIITNEDYLNFFTENKFFLIKKNQMLKIDEKVGQLKKISYSGQIVEKNPFNFIIHKSTPFFLTIDTILWKKSGDLIIKNEFLGNINFEQIITGDIVQGLPKVEEILEARKPKNAAILSKQPGVILKIIQNEGLIKLKTFENSSTKTIKNLHEKSNQQNVISKKKDYIYLGQPLTNGRTNPHNLLILYFNYYQQILNCYEATYLSFKNIQLLLIQKIQDVYNSQGVDIADKHLEIIVNRITEKVTVTSSNYLLEGEIIELKQIEYMNSILKKASKRVMIYSPILLGITKASLMSNSFIASASFQETTKILTAAAIEGKLDWLRGLKENVIIGKLIPVGTGFL